MTTLSSGEGEWTSRPRSTTPRCSACRSISSACRHRLKSVKDWSLVSIQFKPEELRDPEDLSAASVLFRRMAEERLGGAPVSVRKFLTTGASDQNPMDTWVNLHLYEIDFAEEPALNPRYYTDSEWLSPADYEARSAGLPCGLCLRLWSDYAWCMGITDRPFIPHPSQSSAA